MKLEEFHVGEFSAGFESQSNPVSGGNFRIGVKFIELARAAGCQNQPFALKFFEGAGAAVHCFDALDSSLLKKDFGGQVAFKYPDTGCPDAFTEGNFDMFSGRIAAGMQDTRHAVGSFHRQSNFSFQRIEGNAEFHQVGNPVRSFCRQNPDCFFIAQTFAGCQSVFDMQFGGIIQSDRRSNSALRMPGIAFFDAALGKNKNTALLFSQQGSIKTSNTTAYQYVVVITHPGDTPCRIGSWFRCEFGAVHRLNQ